MTNCKNCYCDKKEHGGYDVYGDYSPGCRTCFCEKFEL